MILGLLSWSAPLRAQLSVTGGLNADQLTTAIVGPGVTFSNAQLTCPDGASGIFSDGATTNIGLGSGVLFTSGSIDNAVGPNVGAGTSQSNNAPGDTDLDALTAPFPSFDACALEFDFSLNDDGLAISYVFASEEYPEYFCSSFNDAFGFLVTGPKPGGGDYSNENIAILPGTSIPVSINNVGPGECNGVDNSALYISNAGGTTIEYDGFTAVITSQVPIVPNETYHIKIVIGDAGDRVLDSGVFIQTGSFTNPCDPDNDGTAPIATNCPEDITVTIPVSQTTAQVNYTPPGVADDCPGASISLTSGLPSGADFPIGTTTVVYTAVDAAGNSSTCSFDVTVNVETNVAPTAICQAVVVSATDNCEGLAMASDFDGGSTDPNGDPLTFSVDLISPYSLGVTNVTLTVDDGKGGTDQCTTTITVEDDTAPVITCVASPNVLLNRDNDSGECSYTAQDMEFDATATDNCGVTSLTNNYNNTGTLDGATFPVGTITKVLWTALDAAGNLDTCSIKIEVVDNEAPVLSCVDLEIELNADGTYQVGPNDFFQATGATDNCGIAFFNKTTGGNLLTCNNLGTASVKLFVTDVNGQTSSCTVNQIVTDPFTACNQPPDAVCQPVTVSADANCLDITTVAADFDGGSTDPENDLLTFSVDPEGPYVLGVTNVTLTVDDGNGGTATCATTITVVDDTAPSITCPSSVSLSADPSCQAMIADFTGGTTATDNCSATDNISIFQSPPAGSMIGLGTTTVTLTAQDVAGVTSTCTVDVTVNDSEAPILTGVPTGTQVQKNRNDCLTFESFINGAIVNSTMSVGGRGPILVTGNNPDFQGVNAAMIFDSSNPAPGDADLGTPNETFGGPGVGSGGEFGQPFQNDRALGNVLIISEDLNQDEPNDAANGTSIDIDLSVVAPVTVVSLDLLDIESSQGAYVELINATGGTITTIPFTNDAVNGIITFDLQNTPNVAIVRVFLNGSGAIDNLCFFDPNDPEIPEAPMVTATDNCDDPVTVTLSEVTDDSNAGCTGEFILTRTWSATDAAGNPVSESQDITVEDTEGPVILGVPGAITVDCLPPPANPTALDNCDPDPSLDFEEIFSGNQVTRTWTATDECGNTNTATQIISFLPNGVPTIDCPADITVLVPDGTTESVVDYTAPVGSDDCPGAVTQQTAGLGSGATFPVGETIETYTVTDVQGQMASCSFTVTVVENSLPFVSEFILVDAQADNELFTLMDGMQYNINDFPTDFLSIRAATSPEPTGSVRLELDGPINQLDAARTENVSPYAIFGDGGGNYNGRTFVTGSYTITATPYTGSNLGGDMGTPLTITFELTDDLPCGGAGFTTYYADTDMDGFGDPANSVQDCTPPNGFVTNADDCDDMDVAVNPNATEVCDGIDNNCDGQVDEGLEVDIAVSTIDQSSTSVDIPNGSVVTLESLFPGIPVGPATGSISIAIIICNTGSCELDLTEAITADGLLTVDGPFKSTLTPGDCTNFLLEADELPCPDGSPVATTVTIPSNDPDEAPFVFTFTVSPVDSGTPDADGDGVSDLCDVCAGDDAMGDADGDGFCADVDCDDTDPAINENAQEICDGVDNDCDGLVDGDDPSVTGSATWYADGDGDGFGDPGNSIQSCSQPDGFVSNADDCDDGDPNTNPDADEICDDEDNDCDGTIDEDPVTGTPYYTDADGDGFGAGAAIFACSQPAGTAAVAGDCDDSDGTIFPGATDIPCDGIDQNCDGSDAIADADGDGFTCDVDCDDSDATVFPGADEFCDGLDNDCDGTIDEDPVDSTPYYTDADGDGFGAGAAIFACTQPAGTAAVDGDCDDSDDTIFPGATELCDGIDNNCDGLTDDEDPNLACGQSVISFILIDAATDLPVPGFDPLLDGAMINANVVTNPLSIQAVTNPNVVGSVLLQLTGPVNSTRMENVAPYALFGDSNGNFLGQNLPVGSYTITATPYSGSNGSGDVGLPLTVTFEVIDQIVFYDVILTDDGNGTTAGEGSFLPGTVVTVTATPNSMYEFVSWTDVNTGNIVSTTNPYSFQLNADVDLQANFQLLPCGGLGFTTYYADVDGDGFGDPNAPTLACSQPTDFVLDNTDCDDSNDLVNPGATEICNGIDDNCDGQIDEGFGGPDIFVERPGTGELVDGGSFNFGEIQTGTAIITTIFIKNLGPCPLIYGPVTADNDDWEITSGGSGTVVGNNMNNLVLSFNGIPCPDGSPIEATFSIPHNDVSGVSNPYTFTLILTPIDPGTPDSDGDGVSDFCDFCDGDDATGDTDNDGICDDLDPIEGPLVTEFQLIDADDDVSLGPITDDAQFFLGDLPTNFLNVEAIANNLTESVVLTISGPLNGSRTESVAPYALFGDSGGNYFGRTFSAGEYTVTATPYDANNGNGTAGPTVTVTFEVLSGTMLTFGPGQGTSSITPSTPTRAGAPELDVFPNPFAGEQLELRFSEVLTGPVSITLLSHNGQEQLRYEATEAEGRANLSLDLTGLSLPGGFYLLRVQWPDGTVRTKKVVKVAR